jgi:cytochrome c peroxidase
MRWEKRWNHWYRNYNITNKYRILFKKAFNETIITGEHTLKAMSQFMLTLVSANSKYDSVMRKQSHFTEQENKGYQLFKQHCSSCHTEPLFTHTRFENNGLPIDTTLNDVGRMRITKNSQDSLKFKVPTLRNIEFSFPYMHDGRFKKISEVLKHYTSGIVHSKTLAKQLQQPILIK